MDFVTQRKDCYVTRIDISYLKIDMSSDPMLGGEMKRKANNMPTIPQIYINNARWVVLQNFYSMQQFGKLEKL